MRDWRRRLALLAVVGLAACDVPGTHSQLDLLWSRFAGEGTAITPAVTMPDARYSAFFRDFPDRCVDHLALVRDQAIVTEGGRGMVWDLLVIQRDLQGGNYHFEVTTSRPACAWEIQTVLNSVLIGPGPTPPHLNIDLPPAASLSSTTTADFDIVAVGGYEVTYAVGPNNGTGCRYEIRLLGPGGLAQPVASGDVNGFSSTPYVLLSPGRWHAHVETGCAWTVRVAPSTQGNGGAMGF